MHTYDVDVRRGDRWWVLSVPEIPAAHSQARTLTEVQATARDLISVMLDVPGDTFVLNVRVLLPADVEGHLRQSAELREQARRAQSGAAAELRLAARRLRELGMSVRDVGAALGVSFQRAHQLVTDSA